MRKILLHLLVLFVCFLSSCNRVVEIEVPPVKGAPSGAVLKTKTVSYEDGIYTVEVDIHIVDDRGQYIRNLEQDDFVFRETYYEETPKVIGLDRGLKTEYKGSYEALFLMDQSGSIESNDPYDSRINAANIFLDNLGSGDKVGLAEFCCNGYNVLNEIGSDLGPIRANLDYLAISENGGTPLYFSTYSLIEYLSSLGGNEDNRALIVFTDGADTEGVVTPDEIIALANQKNVEVFTIGLGASLSNLDILTRIANDTGGYFMWAQDAEQIISYFGTLGNLLEGDASYYKLSFQIKTDSPINSPTTILYYVDVALSPVKSITIPVSVTLP